MPSNKFLKNFLHCAALILLAAAAAHGASVSDVRGITLVKVPDSEWFPCVENLGIKNRMSLRTGRNSRIAVRFAGDSFVIIRAQTEVYVDNAPGEILAREDAVHLILEQGEIVVVNRREGRKNEIRVSTPGVALSVQKGVLSIKSGKEEGVTAGVAQGSACAQAKGKTVCMEALQSTRIAPKKPPSAATAAGTQLLAMWREEGLLPEQADGDFTLRVTRPEKGTIVNKSPVKVVGATRPGATLTINGKSVSVQPGGGFSAEVPLSEGANTIALEARHGDKRASAAVTVTLDTAPPLLTVSQPMDYFDPTVLGSCDSRKCRIQIFGLTEPGVALFINRTEVSSFVEQDGSFYITDFPLARTETMLRIEAIDASGLKSTQTVTVGMPLDSDGDLRPDHLDMCPYDPSCQ
jgi:hypothetical protein